MFFPQTTHGSKKFGRVRQAIASEKGETEKHALSQLNI